MPHEAYFFILFLLLSITAAFPQFHFGVKAGVGFNDIHWSRDLLSDDSKSLTSMHLGAYAKMNVLSKLSIIPELQYITKGYSIDANIDAGTEAFRLKIHYVELPVLINYRLIKWLSAEAGPSLGVKIKAITVSDSGSSDFVNKFVEPIDFGILGGLRFNLTERLAIVTRYNYSFSPTQKFTYNIGPDPNNSTTGTLKAYNRNAQLSVAYQIR